MGALGQEWLASSHSPNSHKNQRLEKVLWFVVSQFAGFLKIADERLDRFDPCPVVDDSWIAKRAQNSRANTHFATDQNWTGR
jgi:hypothetical protein